MSLVCSLLLICWLFNTVATVKDDIGVTREVWSNVVGDSLQNLLADSRFPHRPTKVDFIKDFDVPDSGNNGKNIAQRVMGYFVPPQNGEYKFFSSCDGSCEVFLGMNGMKGENNRIISQEKSTYRDEFDKYPEQVSHTIALKKRKRYYIEAISKQRTGTDTLSVGVELPNGKKLLPIPGRLLRKAIIESDIPNSGDGLSLKNVIVPRRAKNMYNNYHKQPIETVAGVNRELHSKNKASQIKFAKKSNEPIVDFEGKKFNDKDAVEPGINIFSDNKDSADDDDDDDDKNTAEENFDDSSGEKHENSGNVEFAIDEKSSYQNAITEKPSESNGTRVIETNFGNENQSFTNVLQEHAKSSDLKLVMPGGHHMRLSDTTKNDKDDKEEENIINIDLKDANPTNLSSQIAQNIQSVTLTTKKARTSHVVGHNRPALPGQTKISGKARSYFEDGGYDGNYGGLNMDHGMGHEQSIGHGIGLPMGPMSGGMDEHGAMPEGHAEGVEAPLHQTGPVAMVPALLHHDHPEYDHETGHMHEGGTHIEPLVPVHGGGVEGHGEMVHGGGMEHSMGMMGHGMMPGMDMSHGIDAHHIPEIHADMPDNHHHFHHHLEPLPVAPIAPTEPKKPHKPDIIKVEFVPDEATVEITNKSKIATKGKKAGTVRVQFIAGDVQSDSPSKPNVRHHAPTRETPKNQNSEPARETAASKPTVGTTMTVQTGRGSTKMTFDNVKTMQDEGQEQTVTGNVMSGNGKIMPFHVTMVTGNDKKVDFASSKAEKSKTTENYEGLSDETNAVDQAIYAESTARLTKEKSRNGYELHPSLPLNAETREVPKEQSSGVAGEGSFGSSSSSDLDGGVSDGNGIIGKGIGRTNEAPGNSGGGGGGFSGGNFGGGDVGNSVSSESSMMVNDIGGTIGASGNSGGGGRGGGGGDGGGMVERIDPALTTLGQQYAGSLQPDQKASVMSGDSKSSLGQEDGKVFFNGGTTTPEQPDPNPTREAPTDPGEHGPIINPVAGHLMSAMSQQAVTAEEALQMMNDFVSGNQDMNKAAKNMEGMLGQISSQRHKAPIVAPSTPKEPEYGVAADDMSHHFIDNQNEVNPDLQTGFTNPSLPKLQLNNLNPTAINNNLERLDMFNENNEPHDQPFGQRDETVGASPNNDGNPINQLSLQKPPPVHFFDGQTNSMHHQHDNNLVMETAQTSNDGFSNPSLHKGVPQLPSSGGSMSSILDEIDPHETSSESSLADPNNGVVKSGQNQEPFIPMVDTSPVVDIPTNMPTMTRGDAYENNNIAGSSPRDVSAEYAIGPPGAEMGYTDNSEADLPQGHLVGETPMAYNDDGSNFARKFRTPHATNVQHLHRTKTKVQTENRKHDVLAAMYTDAIFAEDFADIESLKGDLQGKTLTNFDRQEALQHHVASTGRSTTKGAHLRTEVKASFPLEGSVDGSEIGGSTLRSKVPKSPHVLKKHKLTSKRLHVNATKRTKILKHKQNNRYRSRRSIKAFSNNAPAQRFRKARKLAINQKRVATTRNINPFTSKAILFNHGSTTLHKISTAETSQKSNNAIKAKIWNVNKTLASNPQLTAVELTDNENVALYPQKTDWVDIHPVDEETTETADANQLHYTRENFVTNHVQPESTDRATLRHLVAELKDVLHKLHQVNPTHKRLLQASSERAYSNFNHPSPELTQFEAVSKGDLISAFSNIGKPQPIHSVDIESFSQDVWEPGLKGINEGLYGPGMTYKRETLPRHKIYRNSKRTLKLKPSRTDH